MSAKKVGKNKELLVDNLEVLAIPIGHLKLSEWRELKKDLEKFFSISIKLKFKKE